jgi:hypothetical protein
MKTKILKTLIVLAVLAGLGILGYSIVSKWWYVPKYGEADRYDLSDNLSVEYNYDGVDILNYSTGKVVGHYDEVLSAFLSEESKHCTRVVVKNDLRGYISAKTGEVIFEPQFLHAWVDDPESGLAACVNKDHKLGFVNVQTKEIAIPFQFDFDDDLFIPYDQPIFDFVFHYDFCIVPGKDGKIGMIDKTGKLLLPAEYVDIINWRDANTSTIILKKDAGEDSYYRYVYGVCDRNFKIVLPVEYDGIISTHAGSDYDNRKYIVKKNYVQKLYDEKGKLLSDFYVEKRDGEYDDKKEEYIEKSAFEPVFEPNNITLSIYIKYYLDGYCGIIDTTNRVVIPAKYNTIEYLGNGNFACNEDEYSALIKDKNYH